MKVYYVWQEIVLGTSQIIVSGNLEYCRSVVKLLREGDNTLVVFWIEDGTGRLVSIEE